MPGEKSVQIRFLETGFAKQLEAFWINDGRLKTTRFPATVAVIDHPSEGIVLFDTGYSHRFYEHTRYFPERFYRMATPTDFDPSHTAVRQLSDLGIHPNDVRVIVLSHFHADHIAGVGDFSRAKFIYRQDALVSLQKLSRFGAVRAGFLRGLLPEHFEARSLMLTDDSFRTPVFELGAFQMGHDLFSDQSVILIDLPGHHEGHMGALVRGHDQNYFLVADACYGRRAYEENRPPPSLLKFIFSDWAEYKTTLAKIHDLSKVKSNLVIVPCHCLPTYERMKSKEVAIETRRRAN